MFICSFSIISFISIMFALSIITLKTSVAIGISVMLACISPILLYFIVSYKLFFLSYTPLPYLNYSLVINNYNYYVDILKYTNINKNIELIIYTKKDITN